MQNNNWVKVSINQSKYIIYIIYFHQPAIRACGNAALTQKRIRFKLFAVRNSINGTFNQMFWHNILKRKHTHRQHLCLCVCLLCICSRWYLFTFFGHYATFDRALNYISMKQTALRGTKCRKVFSCSTRRKFFLPLFFFFGYFRWQRQRVQQARRHFWPNCVWNWIAIVNNSFPKNISRAAKQTDWVNERR